jgi:hypothetical protein
MCLASENGNGTLAKLVELRHAFLATAQDAATQYRATIKELRDAYLNQVVDVTLGDPRLTAFDKIFAPTVTAPIPEPIISPPPETDTVLATDMTTEMPAKMPLKNRRTRISTCPSCGAPIRDVLARFCSACASPLFSF